MQFIYSYLSPLGKMTLTSDGTNLTGLWFNYQQTFTYRLEKNHREKLLPIFIKTMFWLDLYFAKKIPNFEIPVSLNGSTFQLLVWQIIKQIPYGHISTYGQISKEIANQICQNMAAQAVGSAVSHNPVLIIIPCHRVIGVNNRLSGYVGGINREVALLEIEQVNINNFSTVQKPEKL